MRRKNSARNNLLKVQPGTFLLISLVLPAFLLGSVFPAPAREKYATYADRLLKKMPGDARIRPDLETYLSQLASNARNQMGKKGLKHSALLNRAARAQAAEMLAGNFVGHKSKGGYSFQERLRAYSGHRNSYWGENAARDRLPGPADKKKARRLFNMWLRSSGHRANLMRTSFSFVSTGVVQKGNVIYAIQIFWDK